MVTKKTTSSGSGKKDVSAGLSLPKKKRPTLKVGGRPVSPVAKKTTKAKEPTEVEETLDEAPAKPARPSRAPKAKKVITAARAESRDDAREIKARKVALACAAAGLEKKALHVEIIDVRGRVDYADFVVVMSGKSDRQVGALAKFIEIDVQGKEKVRCLGVEGMPQGSWVLMDFGDVIVHIFHEDVRGYYDLETLWLDASRLPVED